MVTTTNTSSPREEKVVIKMEKDISCKRKGERKGEKKVGKISRREKNVRGKKKIEIKIIRRKAEILIAKKIVAIKIIKIVVTKAI